MPDEITLEDCADLLHPVSVHNDPLKQVSREVSRSNLVTVDFSHDALLSTVKSRDQGMVPKDCYELCALARVVALAYHHGWQNKLSYHTLHYITKKHDYCVFYFDNTVRNTVLPDWLHDHIKQVFRAALVLSNFHFTTKVDWQIKGEDDAEASS